MIGDVPMVTAGSDVRFALLGGKVIGAGALVMRSTGNNEVYVAPRTQLDPRTSQELGL